MLAPISSDSNSNNDSKNNIRNSSEVRALKHLRQSVRRHRPLLLQSFPSCNFDGINRSSSDVDVNVNVNEDDGEMVNGKILHNDDMLRRSAAEILECVTELLLLLHDESSINTKDSLNRNGMSTSCNNKTNNNDHNYLSNHENILQESKKEVRDAFGLLLQSLGYADDQLLEMVLATLPALASSAFTPSRELLLEVLPYCISPSSSNTSVYNHSTNHAHLEKEKQTQKRILDVLKCKLMEDHTSLISILGILQVVPLHFFQREVLELCVGSLTIVTEADLPTLIKTIFSYFSSNYNEACGNANGHTIDSSDLPAVEQKPGDIATNSHRAGVKGKKDSTNESSKVNTRDQKGEEGEEKDTMIMVLEAVRSEWKLVEDSHSHKDCDDISNNHDEGAPVGALVGEVFLNSLANCKAMARAYKSILYRHFLPTGVDTNTTDSFSNVKKKKKKKEKHSPSMFRRRRQNKCSTSSMKKDKYNKPENREWTLLDMIGMLVLFHSHPTHRHDMVHLIHALCARRCFPFRPLVEKLIILYLSPTTPTQNNSTSSTSTQSCLLYSSIAPAMIELSLYLLLSPIRYSSSSSISSSDLTLMANCIHLQNTLAQTKDFVYLCLRFI